MNEDAKEAQRLYDSQSDLYAKNQAANNDVKILKAAVYKVAGSLESKKLLFAGCGDGAECIEASEQGAYIEGIDISSKNIEKARVLNLHNSNFQQMDIQQMSFQDKSFDLVISILAVMYVGDINALLTEFKRVLKPNGRIIIAVPHPVAKMIRYSQGNYFVHGKQNEVWQGIERFNYYRLFEDYVQSFSKAGLFLSELVEPEYKFGPEKIAKKELRFPRFIVFELQIKK